MALMGFTTSVCLLFSLVNIITVKADESCCESWKLERDTPEPVFVGFTNGTYAGRYTSLLWHWQAANISGEWETTLWISHVSQKLLGSMAFRDEDGKISNSIMWRLDNDNLTWSSRGDKLTDVNWSMTVCNIASWKYETDETGNWKFKLGIHRKKRDGNKHNEQYYGPKPPVNGQRSWEIVREVLDRVFGNGEDIRREGWVSHITQFLKILGIAVIGDGLSGTGTNDGAQNGILIPSTPPEVEVFNPSDSNFLAGNNTKTNKIKNKTSE